MNKYIFLDFDGVLNHEMFYRERNNPDFDWDLADYPMKEFCPKSISYLNELIEKTNAEVIVSSTWRMGRCVEDLQLLLDSVGFKGKVCGKTDSWLDRGRWEETVRGQEIEQWLEKNDKICTYVILDDDCDMLDSQKDNFIKIDSWFGLTKKDVEKAIEILKI